MRFMSYVIGCSMMAIGLAGLAALAFGPRDVIQVELTRVWVRLQGISQAQAPGAEYTDDELSVRPLGGSAPSGPAEQANAAEPARRRTPITRVVLPSIGVAAEVVPARRVRSGAAHTWEVPAHRAGHADQTAGAGEAGNAVLFGHVSSRDAGNVFKDLDRLRPGDEVEIVGEERSYSYRVLELRRVPRDDMSVVGPADTPVLTLITCTGTWLPQQQDYSHRLVVRAALQAAG
jgi:LPXTG-site transpeptidase (sortase) family protein